MRIGQPIALAFLCFIFVGCNKSTPASSQQQPFKVFNPQPLMNSIDKTIQDAVGSGIDDEIPGYDLGDDQVVVDSAGIECPTNNTSVATVSKILVRKLESQFGTNLNSPRIDFFPPNGDVVITTILKQDGSDIQIAVSIFKRGSGRVELFSTLIARNGSG